MYILWIHNKQIKTLQPHIKKLLKTSLKRRHNEAALPQMGTCSILARVCKGITSKYTSEQQGLQHLKRINISSSGFFKKNMKQSLKMQTHVLVCANAMKMLSVSAICRHFTSVLHHLELLFFHLLHLLSLLSKPLSKYPMSDTIFLQLVLLSTPTSPSNFSFASSRNNPHHLQVIKF